MGREVRMVPPDWKHPKEDKDNGRGMQYIPLLAGDFDEALAEWLADLKAHPPELVLQKWEEGYTRPYPRDAEWQNLDPKHVGMSAWEYYGGEPGPDPWSFMPKFPEGTATHLMMYEDTSEGTPISPAFATPEELARWLADNNASAFGNDGAPYEAWLATIKQGWAFSMVKTPDGELQSGVEFNEKH